MDVYHTLLARTLQESCICGQEFHQVAQCSFVCGSCDCSTQFLEIHQVGVGEQELVSMITFPVGERKLRVYKCIKLKRNFAQYF